MKINDLTNNLNFNKNNEINTFYVSFSDLMVILSVFFVMIISMSKIDIGPFEKIRSAFTGTTDNTLLNLSAKLKKIATTDPGIPGISVAIASDGIRLDMDTSMLFDLGSAVLKPKALQPLTPILEELLNTIYKIDIEGHTDDIALYKKKGLEIETNWSLSGRRASSVVNYLLEVGFSSSRLRIIGHADTRPKVKIKGKKGSQLKAARAQNRRVTLLIR